MHFLSLDIETSGANHVDNDIIAIGVGLLNATGEVVDKKRFIFLPDNYANTSHVDIDSYRWEKRCREEFLDQGNTRQVLSQMINIIDENSFRLNKKDATHAFMSYIYHMEAAHVDDITIVTDNTAFDIGRIDALTATYGYKPLSYYHIGDQKFSYEGIFDIGMATMVSAAYEFGTLRSYWNAPISWKGTPNPFNHNHDPMYDALHIGYEAYKFWSSKIVR